MDRRGKQCAQRVAFDALGQIGVCEGEGLAQRVGNRGVRTRRGGILLFGAGTAGVFDFLETGHKEGVGYADLPVRTELSFHCLIFRRDN